jgi:LmbE family N-acetylglucosaminyl deacetylase
VIRLGTGRLERIVAVGAHCDDIAIGAGGTLLTLCHARPGIRVDALVLTGGGGEREQEERAALAAFCPGADLRLTVHKLPDGRLPAHWDEAKRAVEELRAGTEPDLVLAPRTDDAHQDHRGLAKLMTTAFRDHLVLGYEIVKWDGDLGRPSALRRGVRRHQTHSRPGGMNLARTADRAPGLPGHRHGPCPHGRRARGRRS